MLTKEMPTLKFTSLLNRYFPELQDTTLEENSIIGLIEEMNLQYPGIQNYILDDQKMLRKHVNIFVDGAIISDRKKLDAMISENSEVYFIQALSGG